MKPNKQEVAKRIKKIREESGLSIANMAERLGISKSTFNSYIRGLALPPDEIMEKIALFAGVAKDWIYYGELEEYIFNYLISKGNEKFLKDFPELIRDVKKQLEKQFEESKYPHPIAINNAFYDISYPMYNNFIIASMGEFVEEIKKYPLYSGTPKYNSEKYVNRVIALIHRESPPIKYGESDRVYEIAKNEFQNRVEIYNESRTKLSYLDEAELLVFLEKKLKSDEGTIELISGLIYYFGLNQKKIPNDLVNIFRSIHPEIKKIL